jgi:hypothetical protein
MFAHGNFVVADWERGTGWLCSNGQHDFVVSRQEFLAGSIAGKFDLIVIEAPHMGVRGPLSKAQIYSEDELEVIAELYPGQIALFPAKLTPRAQTEALGYHDKTRDAEAIHNLLTRHPDIPLMAFPPPHQRLYDALNEIRTDMTIRLNELRTDDVKYKDPQFDHARELLHAKFNAGELTDELIDWFGLKLKFQGKPKERLDFKEAPVMSVYVAVRNRDGSLRRDPAGRPIGREFFLKLLKQSAFHDKAGTARSNLMYHFLRNHNPEMYKFKTWEDFCYSFPVEANRLPDRERHKRPDTQDKTPYRHQVINQPNRAEFRRVLREMKKALQG